MTAKEKAKEIYDKYYFICQEFTEEIQCSIQAKKCSLSEVESIIYLLEKVSDIDTNYFRSSITGDFVNTSIELNKYKIVKSEIEKL